MSIVSLERFLYDARKRTDPDPPTTSGPTGSYLELSSRLMAAVTRSVLVGETYADLANALEDARKNLNIAGEAETGNSAREVEAILQQFQARVRQTDLETAREFKGVLDVLNSAFVQLHARTEKSDERLKHLEAGLSRASRYDDLNSLRSHLGKMLEFVRQESMLDQTAGKAEIEALGNQISQVHKASTRFRVQCGGREEALEHLKSRVQPGGRSGLQAALFVLDSLRALRARHGEETANTILQEVIRKEIQPLAPEGSVYAWSQNSVLLIWEHVDAAAAPREVAARLKSPLECRAFVGTRVAVFNIAVRSMVTAAHGSLEDLELSLDRFWKVAA